MTVQFKLGTGANLVKKFQGRNKTDTSSWVCGDYIDNTNNLVFWCRFLSKLEPWYAVYIM